MNKKSKKCIFCGSTNITLKEASFAPFLEERMFLFKPKSTYNVHCNKCKINYSSYRPTDEELGRLYAGYRDENYQKQRQKYEPLYTKEFNYNLGFNPQNIVLRKNFLENIIKKYIKNKNFSKILDYGGDSGQYIPDCFSESKKFVYDISNVPTISNVENISKSEILLNPNFDFIMCCHVLEHVADPISIVAELISFCKKDGYIYIEVPYEPQFESSNSIHEHLSAFSKETFSMLWDIFCDIDIIDTRTLMNRNYVLLRKRKISKIHKCLKKIISRASSYIKNFYVRIINIRTKFITLYYLSR